MMKFLFRSCMVQISRSETGRFCNLINHHWFESKNDRFVERRRKWADFLPHMCTVTGVMDSPKKYPHFFKTCEEGFSPPKGEQNSFSIGWNVCVESRNIVIMADIAFLLLSGHGSKKSVFPQVVFEHFVGIGDLYRWIALLLIVLF